MKKTLISLLLVVVLVLALAVPAMAAEAPNGVKLTGPQDAISVAEDTYLDLAGNSVGTITIENGAKLYLYDSTTDGYTVSEAKVGTIEGGTPVRAFVLPEGMGNGRFRYITIQENDGSYSAHRFYIGVTSSMLYPKTGSLYFKLTYKGDETLTSYVDQFGGKFDFTQNAGVISAEPLTRFADNPTAGADGFTWTVGIGNIVNAEKTLEDLIRATTEGYLNAQACLKLKDQIGTEVTSSIASKSFQTAVLEAQNQVDGMTAAEIKENAEKVGVLTDMYQRVITAEKADLLEAWTTKETRIPYYCLCGASVNGGEHALGCEGEKDLTLWRPFDGTTEIKNLAEDSTDASVYNYYLTGPYDADINTGLLKINQQDSVDSTSETVDPITVRLDLNGHNITRGNDRVFWLSYQSDTTVCNSRPEKGGVIQSKGVATDGFAGVVWFLKADSGTTAFKMMDGVTLKAREGYNQQTYGGIGLIQGGTFTMYGGKVEGATVTESNGGGAFRITQGELDMQGGVITGGEAPRGGNIYIAGGGKLTMSGEAEITKGKQTSTSYRGGNVYVANATSADVEVIHLSGNARITEGESVSSGGNVSIGLGSMILEGNAKIIGGKVNGRTSDSSADIILTNTTNLTISGNGTAGYVHCSNANAAVKVEGSAKILGLKTNGGKVPTVTGALTKDALIRVTDVSEAGATLATIKADVDLGDQAALTANRIQGSNSIGGVINSDGNIVESEKNNHCVCGAMVNGVFLLADSHADGCNEESVDWNKYTGTISASGKYYLTENLTEQACATLSADQTVYIDLNGYNLHATERAFSLSAAGETLWICNTAPAFEGTGIISGKGTTGSSGATVAGVINLNLGKEFRLFKNVTIQLADGHLDVTRGGTVYVRNIQTVNMYGGKIIGGKVKNYGGAVDLRAADTATVFTMYDGEIIGGEAAQGGAVHVDNSSAKFIMQDGTITGGKATGNDTYEAFGGAVCMNAGTLTVNGGTIIGGEASNGGAVYLNKSATISGDAKIIGGTATEYGGAVYVAAGTLTMEGNASITGGEASNGGAVYLNKSATIRGDAKIIGGTATEYGGSVYVAAGTLTMEGNASITGGEAQRGGAVFLVNAETGATISNNAKIVGGTATQYGGAVFASADTALTLNNNASISGGKVTGYAGSDSRAGNVYVAKGAALTLNNDSSIYGGTVSSNVGKNSVGGNIFVYGEVVLNDTSHICDGVSKSDLQDSHGGNAYVTGDVASVTLNDSAYITGGACESVSAGKAGGQGGNVYLYNGATLNVNESAYITGGTGRVEDSKDVLNVDGKVYMNGGQIGNITSTNVSNTTFVPELHVQGNAVVDNVVLSSSETEDPAMLIVDAALGEDAQVNISSTKADKIVSATTEMTNETWLELVDNVYAITTSIEGKTVQYKSDGIYIIDSATDAGTIVCPFGCTVIDPEHTGEGCPWAPQIEGIPLTSTKLPITESGYYYLTDNIESTNQLVIGGSEIETELDVILDLNGYNLSGGIRALQIWNDAELTLKNTDYFENEGTGTRPADGGGIVASTVTDPCSGFAIVQTARSIAGTHPTLNLYDGVTLKKTDTEATFNCGGVYINENAVFNMYGGTVIGSPVQANAHSLGTCGTHSSKIRESGNGGAIYVMPGGTVNVYGGEIVGAEVEGNGGAIYNMGTVNLKDVTITGGNAKNGGAIYNEGTLNIDGATISGTAENGSAVYTLRDFSIDGNISIDGTVYLDVTKINLGSELSIAQTFDVYTKQLEGPITAGADAATNVGKITVNGEQLVLRNKKLCILPAANENELLVGFGEADINPTDKQVEYSQAGYRAKYNDGVLSGYYPLSIDGYAQYPAGKAVAVQDGTKYDSLGLKATAIAYSDYDGDVIVMISIDAAFVGGPDAVRKEIAAAVGIPAENIMISATHAHSTPVARDDKIFYDASGNAYELDETYYETYLKGLKKAAQDAIDDRSAIDTLELATVNNVNESSTYDFNQVRNYMAYSTKYLDKFSDATYVGMYTPNHVDYTYHNDAKGFEPESEVDDSVQLVRYKRTDKKDIVIANFQCHPVLFPTGGSDPSGIIHSDVAGAFRTALAEKLKANVAYFSGAGGNVQCYAENKYNQVKEQDGGLLDFLVPQRRDDKLAGNLANCQKWGEDLAGLMEDAGFETLTNYDTNVAADKRVVTYEKNVDTEGGGTIDGYQITLEDRQTMAQAITDRGVIGKYIVSSSDEDSDLYTINFGVDFCKSCYHGDSCPFNGQSYNGNQLRSEWGIYSFYHAKNGLVRRMNNLEGDTAELTLYAYAAGPIAFAGAPYEMFDTNGSEIKNGTMTESYYSEKGLQQYDNRFDMTIVATNTGSAATGYVPSRIGYENGGYSTDISPYAAGSGEQFVTEFLAMLNGLKK